MNSNFYVFKTGSENKRQIFIAEFILIGDFSYCIEYTLYKKLSIKSNSKSNKFYKPVKTTFQIILTKIFAFKTMFICAYF